MSGGDIHPRATPAAASLEGVSVLVLDGEVKAAPAVVRQLGRQGARVIVASHVAAGLPAQRSRYADFWLVHPNAIIHPGDMLRWLDETIDRHSPSVVLPMTDYTIRILDSNRERLSGRTKLALPPADAMAVLFDKKETLDLARSLGLPIPRTWEPASVGEAGALAATLPYPVYVKARKSYDPAVTPVRFARGRFTHDPAHLEQTYRELDEISPLPLIQEAVPGHTAQIGGVWQGGEPVSLSAWITSRSWPVAGGFDVLRRSVGPEEAPIESSLDLMREVGWEGVGQVEWIHDSRDDTWRLLEANGRFYGGTDFSHFVGADIAGQAVRVALGVAAPDLGYRRDVRSRWMEGDLKRLFVSMFARSQARETLEMPGRLEAIADLLAGSALGIHQDDWYADDLGPALASYRRMFSKTLRPQ